jgi:hypothetical protein
VVNYIRGDRIREKITGAVGEIRKVLGAGNYEVWLETTHQSKILWNNDMEDVALIQTRGSHWLSSDHADAQGYLMEDMSAATGIRNGKKSAYWKGGKAKPLCSHWRDPFELENGLYVYGSARKAHGDKNKKPVPTAGVYLDQSWMADFGPVWTTRAMPEHLQKEVPDILAIQWPDMGAIKVWDLSMGVVWALDRVNRGEIVDIACIGSHGRTGTFMAAMLIYMGRTPDEAIAEVRERHCKSAIESVAQEKLIERLYKTRNRKQETK